MQPESRAFKSAEFFASLERAAAARGQSLKDVARKCGVSYAVIERMATGKRPDIASLSALCNWSGLNAASFWEEAPPRQASRFSAHELGDLIVAMVDAKVAGDVPRGEKAERLMREHLKQLEAELHASGVVRLR